MNVHPVSCLICRCDNVCNCIFMWSIGFECLLFVLLFSQVKEHRVSLLFPKLTCSTVWILAETSACSYSLMPSSWAPPGHCTAIRCRWASTTLWAWATALNLSNKSSSSSSSSLQREPEVRRKGWREYESWGEQRAGEWVVKEREMEASYEQWFMILTYLTVFKQVLCIFHPTCAIFTQLFINEGNQLASSIQWTQLLFAN